MRKTVVLSRKWEFPGQQHLTWLLAAAGVGLLPVKTYAGLAAAFAAFLLAPVHLGVDFDLPRRKYRIYRSWAGLKIGVWQLLPVVRHVVLKYHAYRYAPSKRQWSTAPQKAQQYILMLSVANARNGIVLREYELEHLEEARLTATTLAVVLGVDVQEFTPDRTPDNSLLISE